MSNDVTSMRPPSEIAERTVLSEERLLELTEAGYIPHYRIDGGPPMFKLQEVRDWIRDNLVTHCEGRSLDRLVVCADRGSSDWSAPPSAIACLDLSPLDVRRYPPGIYFLCRADKVVYVGQSVTPHLRIPSHWDCKEFDRAYLLPVPRSELNDVEAALIETLKPELNKSPGPGNPYAPSRHLSGLGRVDPTGHEIQPGRL